MKKNIFAIALVVSSFASAAFATEVIEIKTLPVDYYLFRPMTEKVNLDPAKPPGAAPVDAEAMKTRAKKMQMMISELEAEAKKLKLTYTETKLSIVDTEAGGLAIFGLPVSGPNIASVPKDKLKTRPAGKYLQMTFTGNPVQFKQSMEKMRTYYNTNKLKANGIYMYEYSKYPDVSAPRTVLFPIK